MTRYWTIGAALAAFTLCGCDRGAENPADNAAAAATADADTGAADNVVLEDVADNMESSLSNAADATAVDAADAVHRPAPASGDERPLRNGQ